MTRLSELEAFCYVVERRSFTEAARRLGLTQPAVSQQVKRLEREYGTPLVHRAGQEIVATEAGRAVYTHATRILKLYQRSKQELAESADRLSGSLAVGSSTGLGERALPAAMARFAAEHPDLSVTLQVGDSREVLERVLERRIDIGFVGAARADRHLRFEPFAEDRLVVVVSPDHRLAAQGSLSLDEFLRLPLVLQQPGSGATQALRAALRSQGVSLDEVASTLEVGLQESTKSAVRAGLGCTVISRLGVHEELAAGTLVELCVEGLELRQQFYTVELRSVPRTRLAEAFVHTVAAELARFPS